MEITETAPPSTRVVRRIAYGVLGLYWLTLFVLTHVPRLPTPPEMLKSDKVGHFLAYGLLTVLFMTARATKVELRRVDYFKAFFILGVYGAFDELSQIPVGRSAELLDWCADLTGIGLGLLGFAILCQVIIKWRRNSRNP